MKNSGQKAFSTLATTVGIYLGTLLLTYPVAANDYSRINSGLIPRELNFFQQGREQFEREIQLLIKSSRTNQETILKVSPNSLPTQEDLLRLEKPQVVPSEPNKSESN